MKYKTVKKYIYDDILSFTFYESEIFDSRSEESHFCLSVQNRDCGTDEEILLDFIRDYNEFEQKAQAIVREFMLDYICGQISCHIEDNDYKGWVIKADKSGWLHLSNDRLRQYKHWNIYDKEGFERIQDTIIETLDFIEERQIADKWTNFMV